MSTTLVTMAVIVYRAKVNSLKYDEGQVYHDQNQSVNTSKSTNAVRTGLIGQAVFKFSKHCQSNVNTVTPSPVFLMT